MGTKRHRWRDELYGNPVASRHASNSACLDRGERCGAHGEGKTSRRTETSSSRLPVHHRHSFIMPDKERLNGRLHGLLKRFANSSYNKAGRKTRCCWQADSPSTAFLSTPAFPQCLKGAKLKRTMASCPWEKQGQALLPPQTHPAQLLHTVHRLNRNKHKGISGKFSPDFFQGLERSYPWGTSAGKSSLFLNTVFKI